MAEKTSIADIGKALDKLYGDPELTHMLVVLDANGRAEYRYVRHDEELTVVELDAAQSGQLMEIYSRNYAKGEQLAEAQAYHLD